MLLTLRKDAYQKAIQIGVHELLNDKELKAQLKDQSAIDDDESHVAIIISRATWHSFLYASMYYNNVERFHKALLEECVFTIAHACNVVKKDVPQEVLKDHDLI